MKRFLEGRGYATETKYGEVNLAYQNCRTVITTNELPFNSMSDVDALAIKARCIICQLQLRPNSHKEQFPFNAK